LTHLHHSHVFLRFPRYNYWLSVTSCGGFDAAEKDHHGDTGSTEACEADVNDKAGVTVDLGLVSELQKEENTAEQEAESTSTDYRHMTVVM